MSKAIKRAGKSIDGKPWVLTTFSEDDANRLEEMFSGSDRVAVIVGNAYLEALLGDILNNFLVDNDNMKKKALNSPNGILLSFAARADMAYLLGLISVDTNQLLKTIAKLRNQFAHNHKLQNFEDFEADDKAMKTLRDFQKAANKSIVYVDPKSDRISNPEQLYMIVQPALQAELKAAIRVARENRRSEKKGLHAHFGFGTIDAKTSSNDEDRMEGPHQ